MPMTIFFLLLILINARRAISKCTITYDEIRQTIKKFNTKYRCVFCDPAVEVRIDMGSAYDAGGWNIFQIHVLYQKEMIPRSRHPYVLIFDIFHYTYPDQVIFPHDNRIEHIIGPVFFGEPSVLVRTGVHKDPFLPHLIWVRLPATKKMYLYVTTKYLTEDKDIHLRDCHNQLCVDGYHTKSLTDKNSPCLKCDKGYFGFMCLHKCKCKNVASCNIYNGTCGKNNCPRGKTGQWCETLMKTCPTNRYGPGCKHKCFCKNRAQCHQKTGRCSNGCAPGYYGVSCRHACLYGQSCLKPCQCRAGFICNSKTGKCPNGLCSPRYFGINCRNTCPNNKYGGSCHKVCHCLEKDQCNVTNGHCIKGGCENGWFGPRCDIECPNRQQYCQKVCRCKNIDDCSESNDDCPNGCDVRYYGTNCKFKCPDNKYLINDKCEGKCRCVNIRTCNVTNGACGKEGCRSGYSGKSCDIRKYYEGNYKKENNVKEKDLQTDVKMPSRSIHPCFWISMTVFVILLCLTVANLFVKCTSETERVLITRKIEERFKRSRDE